MGMRAKGRLFALAAASIFLNSVTTSIAAEVDFSSVLSDGPELVVRSLSADKAPDDSDVQAILELDKAFLQTQVDKDIDAFTNLLSETIISLTSAEDPERPGQPMIAKGTEVVGRLNRDFFEVTPNLQGTTRPTDIVISGSGDLAYLVGDYVITFDHPERGTLMDRGRYMFTLEKIDGEWEVGAHAGSASVWKEVDGDSGPASGGLRVEHPAATPVSN
ncbi:MAG: nuclear transport factor 2 family protein [Devosia sp.]